MAGKVLGADAGVFDPATVDERTHWNAGDVGDARLPDSGAMSTTDIRAAPLSAQNDRHLASVSALGKRPAAARSRTYLTPKQAFVSAISREIELGTPFLLVPVALGTGAAIYLSLPAEPALYNIAIACILAFSVLIAAIRLAVPRFVRGILAAILVVCAGMGLAQFRTHTLDTTMLGSAVNTTLTGQIVGMEARANGSVRYTLRVIDTAGPHLRYVPEKLRVTSRNAAENAKIGDVLKGRARLMPGSGPALPTGYDFAFHNYFNGIGANGFFFGAPAALPGSDSVQRSFNPVLAIQTLRLRLSERIANAVGGAEGAVASALVTGDKSPIPDAVTDSLRLSGLAHILSISGLHMALVAGTVMFAIRAGLAIVPGWAARRPVKKYAAVAAFAFITLYLFLAGASVATQRSFVMLAIMLGALLTDRAAITMRNLALAAIVVIVVAPEAVVGPGFQMSFAATAALIATYRFWTEREGKRITEKGIRPHAAIPLWQRIVRTVSKYLLAVIVTSVVAGAATGIYASFHFQRVAPFGLLANLLAVPIVSLVTMPLAIIGTLAIPLGLDAHVFAAMGQSIGWVIAISDWVVSLSPNSVTGTMPVAAMLMASAGLVTLTFLQTKLRLAGGLLFAVSAAIWSRADMPLALISEDGRQLALVSRSDVNNGGTYLAANRSRPASFTYEQWLTATRAEGIIKPGNEAGMTCDELGCFGLIESRQETLRLAYIDAKMVSAMRDAGRAPRSLCDKADIIVLAYAPAALNCETRSRVITLKSLATHGAAAIYADDKPHATDQSGPPVKIVHAISGPKRPWHSSRQYSRDARNLPPWAPADDKSSQ